jgi:hypothetical protein
MESGPDERLREFLQQIGMMCGLSEEDLAGLDAAFSAIKEKMDAFRQPFIGDASAQACRHWLDRLLQIFDGFSFTGALEAPTQAHFAIVASWWVVTNRQAKAIRCLIEAGMASDSIPIARSMIEFSLTAAALSRDPGPLLNTILRKTDNEHDYTIRLAKGGPLEIPAEILALVSKTPDVEGEGSPAKNFSNVCRLLGVNDTVLILWRTFSIFCHPTAATAYLLTQPSPTGQVVLRKTPAIPALEPSAIAEELVAVAVQCLLWSGFAVDLLLKDHPMRESLKAIADEAHVADVGV